MRITVPALALVAGAALAAPSALAQTRSEPTRPDANVPPGTSAAKPSGATPVKPLPAADRKFLAEAAQGGLAEVELGKLAAEKATRPDVKAFGQHMVDDHSKANADLRTLADSRGLTVPSDIGAKEAALKKKLEGLSGAAFDKAYVSEMVKDHEHDVAAFERHTRKGHDPDVTAFASRTLPTLKEHLARIEALSKAMRHPAAASKSASR